MSNKKFYIDTNKITWRIIDQEAVILNLDNGLYYSLNEVGTKIWEFISQGKEPNQIVEALIEEYLIDKRELQRDVVKLIKQLRSKELIYKI